MIYLRKQLLFVFAILLLAVNVFSQVGINNDGTLPDPSAMLDVKSTSKGFLPPRLTQPQMAQIINPADGLMVYNITDSKIYVFMASLGQCVHLHRENFSWELV